ncbi:type II toxin-antitoxin system RelE/ParE family toxin [Pararhizobium sp.]|uniref:type II toxin-antitoxin system RelE/ParE family toxin n=1 Tax=Pararhizobium sp. TaxID=1977563 RepID=UPI00271FDC26|nr:type II toxin-antitoxin system RelE/ParE family toxin [Pararhizobium sp.]MDO9416439.1 type II toxin-antitoxin system RelE/ParE family toxin [Pararhizobium sp.]
MNIRLSEAAWNDLLQIGRFIQAGNPARAETFVSELYQACRSLGALPLGYPILAGYERAGIRKRSYRNYLIFYVVEDDTVQILHVLHGARDYQDILPGEE